MNKKELIDFIKQLPDHDFFIFSEDNKSWTITTEWLVGSFAGRSFKAATLNEALDEMIEYFNRHLEHESMVGDIIRKCGYPNLDKVKAYVKSEYYKNID